MQPSPIFTGSARTAEPVRACPIAEYRWKRDGDRRPPRIGAGDRGTLPRGAAARAAFSTGALLGAKAGGDPPRRQSLAAAGPARERPDLPSRVLFGRQPQSARTGLAGRGHAGGRVRRARAPFRPVGDAVAGRRHCGADAAGRRAACGTRIASAHRPAASLNGRARPARFPSRCSKPADLPCAPAQPTTQVRPCRPT